MDQILVREGYFVQTRKIEAIFAEKQELMPVLQLVQEWGMKV
jgi:hypothetical protein